MDHPRKNTPEWKESVSFLCTNSLWVSSVSSVSQSCTNLCDPMDCRLPCARLPCPSPIPGACSNSYPSSWWCHPTISSSVVPFSLFLSSIFSNIKVFSSESALHIRWSKYWSFSFSISPSNECSGLIFFRIDWFDLAVQGTLKSIKTCSQTAKNFRK